MKLLALLPRPDGASLGAINRAVARDGEDQKTLLAGSLGRLCNAPTRQRHDG
jgi:hypothetical protein